MKNNKNGDQYSVVIPFMIEDYEYIQVLGQGSFSVVIKARKQADNNFYAIKIISQQYIIDHDLVKQFEREVQIVQQLNHKHIVKLFKMFHDDTQIYLVMEYCANGDLFQYLQSHKITSENEVKVYFNQIILAISYIHSKGIAHRDLKLQNILVDSENILKLCDFGFAHENSVHDLLKTYCGSPYFASPEIISNLPYDGLKSDMWSVGVILYYLLVGQLPWKSKNQIQLYNQIQTANYTIPETVSETGACLIKSLMELNPNSRLTASQCLNFPWNKLENTQSSTSSCSSSLVLLKKPKNNQNIFSSSVSKTTQKPLEAPYKLRLLKPTVFHHRLSLPTEIPKIRKNSNAHLSSNDPVLETFQTSTSNYEVGNEI